MDEAAQTAANERVTPTLPIAGEVRVWRWSLLCEPERLRERRLLLNQEECSRADRLVSDKLVRRFVVARTGLRRVLGGLLGRPPGEVRFAYGPMGKPRLDHDESEPPLHFNLAHSGDEALLAVAAEPVGADLEQLRPMPRAAAFAERWFHPGERVRLAETAEADRLAAFFRVWTAKEAALKLLGRGVGEALPRILTPPDEGWAIDLPANDQGIGRCWITRLEKEPSAVATAVKPTAIEFYTV